MDNKILATVGTRKITQKDMEELLKTLDPNIARELNTEEGKQRVIAELINQELFYLDAVNNCMDREIGYLSELNKAKVNLLKQYAVNKLLNQVSVSEGEVLNFYTQNKSYFTSGESIRASHILVDSEEKANEILKEIENGLSFEDGAKKYSNCPSKEVGGDLGYFSKGSMVPEFEKAAFELKVGEISSPVKTQFGYHLIKLVDRREAGTKLLDEVKDQIKQQLLLKKQQALYFQKLDELSKKYEIKINQ